MKSLVLLALLLPGLAAAEPWNAPRHLAPETVRSTAGRVSMGEAMELVARTTGGRVVLAQPANVNGHDGYRIKVVTRHGEVRVLYVDGETGALQ